MLRLACYNIAWFARLFDQGNRLVDDDEWSALRDVTRRRQADAIAAVLSRVDADCFAIIEAPNSGRRQSCVAALEGFATQFGLRQRAALIGFENPTEQEIALLFDPDRISAEHAPIGELLDEPAARRGGSPFGTPRFDGAFPADLDGDGVPEIHYFSKPPLEAVILEQATGFEFRLVAVHLKSKGPNVAGSAEARRRRGLESRAKQFAQATWLRARLEEHIAAGEAVVALGDFNDGPGLDSLERVNGRSSVELVAGVSGEPKSQLATPWLEQTHVERWRGKAPATARFFDDHSGAFLDVLIDFIMLSPCLAAETHPAWRIWHPFADLECSSDSALQRALLDASDHFPVSVDLALPQKNRPGGSD